MVICTRTNLIGETNVTIINRNLKQLIGIGAVLLIGAVVPSFASEFSGGYVGADLGMGKGETSGTFSASGKRAVAGGVEAGYNWDINDSNWLLGVDGYVDQTKTKSRDATNAGVPVTADFGDRTYGVNGKLGYAMGEWLPYLDLGIGKIKGTQDLSGYSSSGKRIGLGVDYKIANQWSLGGEYVRFNGRDDSGSKGKDTSLFLKLKYYFDSKLSMAAPVVAAVAAMAEPTPAPAPMSKPVLQRTEKIVLSDTSLFAFDSDVLKSPQSKLDEIAGALSKNSNIANIVITGYTDRLGSSKYNQKLSERRANAVKKYLVDKGIDVNRLSAIGKGKSNAVIECKDKKRSALIKCLEPNRRVEVEEFSFERKVN